MRSAKSWCDGWATGFLACAFLFAGFRDRFEEYQTEFLKRRAALATDKEER